MVASESGAFNDLEAREEGYPGPKEGGNGTQSQDDSSRIMLGKRASPAIQP